MDELPHRPNVVILPSSIDYLDQLVDVQRKAYNLPPEEYDHPEVLTHDKFIEHFRVFPEGQFMALDVDNDRVVGTCTSMIIDYDINQPLLSSWRKSTNSGYLTTHNPNGTWLYGVDCVVLPEYHGQGIGGKLIKARYNVARKLNLRGMVAGSMIIDYHLAAAEGVNVDDYVRDVIAGRRWDGNLSKQIKKGFRILNIIPDYLTESPDTGNYAVAIVWDNPAYRAPKSAPARTQTTTTPVVQSYTSR